MTPFKQFFYEVVSANLSNTQHGDDEYEIGASFNDINPRQKDTVRRIPISMITSRYEGDGKSEKTPDNQESRSNIDQMKNHLKQGGKLPPILVRRHPDTNGYQVIDGHHRYFAHKEAGMKHINVSILPPGRIKGDKY